MTAVAHDFDRRERGEHRLAEILDLTAARIARRDAKEATRSLRELLPRMTDGERAGWLALAADAVARTKLGVGRGVPHRKDAYPLAAGSNLHWPPVVTNTRSGHHHPGCDCPVCKDDT